MAVYQLLTLSSIIVWVYVMPKAFTKRLPELNIPNYSTWRKPFNLSNECETFEKKRDKRQIMVYKTLKKKYKLTIE